MLTFVLVVVIVFSKLKVLESRWKQRLYLEKLNGRRHRARKYHGTAQLFFR